MGQPAEDSKVLQGDVEQMLKSCFLFQDADDETIHFIIQSLKLVSYQKGDPIILEGEVNDHVFFIKKGSVEIVKYQKSHQQLTRLAVLKPGAHFSEFSILTKASKSASAFALEDTDLYQIDGETFINILHEIPTIGQNLTKALAEMNSSALSDSFVANYDPSNVALTPEMINALPPAMWNKYGILPLTYVGRVLLIAAKDPTRRDFLDFCQNTLRVSKVHIAAATDADFEESYKKMSSLTADRAGSEKLIAELPPITPEDIHQTLKNSPYFDSVTETGIQQLTKWVEVVDFQAGDVIINAGDAPEYFYVLSQGRVELSRPFKDHADWAHLLVNEAREGFSDISLILGQPSVFSARATEPTRLLRMPKEVFYKMLTSGAFCLNIARSMAQRLQDFTGSANLKLFSGNTSPDLNLMGHVLPTAVSRQYQVIPLKLENQEVTLGVVNPNDDSVYGVVGRYLRGYRVRFEQVSVENFNSWMIDAKDLHSANKSSNTRVPTAARLNLPPVDGNLALDLGKVLAESFDNRASDVHLEPAVAGFCLRHRVDGVLAEVMTNISPTVGEAIVNRIKVLSRMDISNRMTPQDGQLRLVEAGRDLTARVSTVPTKHGEGAVLRLVRSKSSTVPLALITPEVRSVKILKSVAKSKQGLFLVTGPTGSGKTTTLYSLIAELNRVDVKIISLEDPVELEIPGTTQIEINDRQGLTFAKALRSALRQDPDIMVVGEIRDEESAKIVLDAALSGHLVISTLHTNNSFAIKARLKELGVPLGILADGLIGAMAQRLVRAVCKKCRTLRPTTETERNLFLRKFPRMKPPKELVEGRGCLICNHTGYHDRLPIMEIWHKTRLLEDLISQDGPMEDMLQAARADGFLTLYEFGLRMVLNGLTTLEEIERCMAGAP